MKRFLLLFMVLVLMGACAREKYQRGNYDAAIVSSVKKLKRNPDKMKYISLLEDSYRMANSTDISKIERLKKEGNPNHWDEIYALYSGLENRQILVKQLPFIPSGITFKDYTSDLIASRKNAAEYFYKKGIALLETNNRFKAREAYQHFMKVKTYYENYSDVEAYTEKALLAGRTQIVVGLVNSSKVSIAFDFDRLISELNKLEGVWNKYYLKSNSPSVYHYNIEIEVSSVVASPEKLQENRYTEKQNIKDGWTYALDENGNVKKDSTGNDIKIDKYKDIVVHIVEVMQSKELVIRGKLKFYNTADNKLIRAFPLENIAGFSNAYATANGDFRALKKETLEKTKRKPLPFPPNEVLADQATDMLLNDVLALIRANTALIE